jgi:hypothetical protein
MAHFKHIPELVEFHRKRVERLRGTRDMPPPWEAFPSIPRRSIGWRMGSGEDFWTDWLTWIGALTPEKRDDYRRRHPEPKSWAGILERHFERFVAAPHSMTGDEFWDDEFKKKCEMLDLWPNKIAAANAGTGGPMTLLIGPPGAKRTDKSNQRNLLNTSRF